MGKIILMIPKQFFARDFLEIEAKKEYGIRGDSLIQHFKGEMQELHKHNSQSGLFNSQMIYMCKSDGSNVMLTGTKIQK